MLLIDGVKYEEWTPSNEDAFERVVKEHAQDIFGENSIYFDKKQNLKSLAGVGSIPDGLVIMFGSVPQWHIIEMELSSHPLHEHVISQLSKFINGIKNAGSQKTIADAVFHAIVTDAVMSERIGNAINTGEIYKFLSDLFSTPPVLTIIIEKDTEGLREVISTLAHPKIKVVEFQTFTREEVGLLVHAHLFEPLCKHVVPPPSPPPEGEVRKLEHALTARDLEVERFRIPRRDKQFFPAEGTEFELIADGNTIKTNGRGRQALHIRRNLRPWFRKYRGQLKLGDKVIFTVIEPMKKYRLEIVA
jgi:hypothetical protein